MQSMYRMLLQVGLTVCFVILCLPSFPQQSIIKGVISIHNSETFTGKREYVSNAQVEDTVKKPTSTVTDKNGAFRLVYVGVSEKQTVLFQVRKGILRVVFPTTLSGVAGQEDTIRISMAHPDSIDSYRIKLFNIGKTEAQKKLEISLQRKNKELSALRKNHVKNSMRIKELEDERLIIELNSKKIGDQAEELANRYAGVNLDDASALLKKAFVFFQNGELDSAKKVLEDANLESRVQQIIKERNRLNEDGQNIEKALQLKADLHKTSFEIDRAVASYKSLLELDSTNINTVCNYASCLVLLNQYNNAEKYYNKALEISRKLVKIDPEIYRPGIAKTQNELGFLYLEKKEFDKAEVAFKEALELHLVLARDNPKTYNKNVGDTQNGFGALYTEKKEFDNAEIAFGKALEIFKQLAINDPQTYERYVANTQNNLGNFYYDQNDFDKAEVAYSQALEISNRLEGKSKIFQEDVAGTQYNLGRVYYEINAFGKAEEAFKISIEKRTVNAEKSPHVIGPEVFRSQLYLGMTYEAKSELAAAEVAYSQALEISKRLAKDNPVSHEPDVVRALQRLGNLYYPSDYDKAETAFLQALQILRRLAKESPQLYEPQIAWTQNNLGGVYSNKDDFKKAESAYLEALEIYKQLAEVDQQTFEPSVTLTQGYLNTLSRNRK